MVSHVMDEPDLPRENRTTSLGESGRKLQGLVHEYASSLPMTSESAYPGLSIVWLWDVDEFLTFILGF